MNSENLVPPLLDHSLFNGGVISGMNLECVNNIADAQQQQRNNENMILNEQNSFDLLLEQLDMNNLPEVPQWEDDSLLPRAEMDAAQDSIISASAKQQMLEHYGKFKVFLMTNLTSIDEGSIPHLNDEIMDKWLRYFYFQLRKNNGEPYSPASLTCIRAGINRFINQTRKINIVDGK